jgi:hypothetical protein
MAPIFAPEPWPLRALDCLCGPALLALPGFAHACSRDPEGVIHHASVRLASCVGKLRWPSGTYVLEMTLRIHNKLHILVINYQFNHLI